MKWIAQVLGSTLYTIIFSVIMYYVLVFPLTWLIGRPYFVVFLFFIFLGTIQGLQATIQVFATMPFVWLLKKNPVSLFLSIVLFAGAMVYDLIWLWKNCTGHGFGLIVLGIIVTVLLVELILATIPIMLKCYTGEISK